GRVHGPASPAAARRGAPGLHPRPVAAQPGRVPRGDGRGSQEADPAGAAAARRLRAGREGWRMTNPDLPRLDLSDEVGQPGATDALAIAREQFAHGLLETLHRDGAEDRERRIAGVMHALATEAAERDRWRALRWPLVSGIAALLALTALVFLGLPVQ